MSSYFLFGITITLLVLTLAIESAYYPFLYDDGQGGEEHCCLVQIRGNMCFATPVTRSLVQVNKQCGRFDRPKHRRSGGKNNNNEYIDKISRRLDIQRVDEMDNKIFIELQKPLDKHIVDNDLICLTSTENNINLEKCHVELAEESDDDDDEPPKKYQRRRGPRLDRHKRAIVKKEEEETDDTKREENELRRIELTHPIRIREGRGLSVLRRYQIHRNQIRPTNRQQQKCWSWYRQQTHKIHRNPSKYSKSCRSLTDPLENCINQLIYNTFNHTKQDPDKKLSFSTGSKLYCQDQNGLNKLLGQYHHGKLCFDRDDQVYIEYQFTDIADLSNMYKNKDTLEYIANHDKLTAEFEDDCHGKTNLVEITEPKNSFEQKSKQE